MSGRAAALLPLVAVSWACGGSSDSPLAVSRPPLVLVSIDTLRADRLPAYGYAGVETPAIDRLAADGEVFESAWTHMPLTLPAHASMLTGLLPPAHGVRDNMGYRLDGAGLPWLPRLLAGAGYATGAAVSAFVLRGETGMAEGFDLYEDRIDYRAGLGPEGLQRAGPATLTAVLPWLESVAGRPFFLFLHLYEPHAPYRPPEPWASRYASPYDGEIAAADRVVGDLLAALDRLGLYEQAAIVVTSDHGEGLGDHGEEEHGIFLYRESLQVPLVVKWPGNRGAGWRTPAVAGLIDLVPTLAALAGAELPAGLPGRPLFDLPAAGGAERRLYAESYYPRLYFGWSELVSMVDGRFQYIESPEPELYDLERDPGQRRNLLPAETGAAAPLRRELAAVERRFSPPAAVDAETRRRLEALGYLGGARSAAAGPAPAPASQIHLLGRLQEAVRAAEAGRHREAAAALQEILAANPGMVIAWEQAARSLRQSGQLREALAAYRKAIELSAGTPHLSLEAARVAALLGDYPEAAELARAALDWDPLAPRLLLAQLALAARDLEEAERQAQAALAAGGEEPEALVLLAQVDLARGRPAAGLERIERAEAADGEGGGEASGPPRDLYLVKGNLLAQLERLPEAERALRRQVELFPADARAYGRLALLYAYTGETAAAVEVLRSLVERNPAPAAYALAIDTLRRLGQPQAASELLAEARERLTDPGQLERLLRR